MATSKSLSWNDRIAIIDRYKPTDTEIIREMGVTQDELDTARELVNTGLVVPTPDLDMDSYASIFGVPSVVKPTTKKPTTVTAVSKPAQTANKSVKIPKKRGRKGTNVAAAFGKITSTPVAAEQFVADNAISLHVLRQARRFDVSPEKGKVCVKKDPATKTLMVFRVAPE